VAPVVAVECREAVAEDDNFFDVNNYKSERKINRIFSHFFFDEKN
jgi:hypothetical protein